MYPPEYRKALYHAGVKGMKWGKRKTPEEVAKDVMKGTYGNGADRVKRLTEAGYDPKEVQKIVNNGGKAPENTKNKLGDADKKKDDKTTDEKKEKAKQAIKDIVKQVINGKYGNGSDRVNALTKKGYDASDVQHQVNVKLLGEKRANEIAERKKTKSKSQSSSKAHKSTQKTKSAGRSASVRPKVNTSLLNK